MTLLPHVTPAAATADLLHLLLFSLPLLGLVLDPAGRRATHPLTVLLWGLLRSRSREDRRYVFWALSSGRRMEATMREQLALRSLGACAHDLDAVPSARSYQAWREDQECPAEYLSVKQIRLTFGSWAKALGALGLEPTPDVLSCQLCALGGPFSPAELIVCLQTCARITGTEAPTFRGYKRWALREMRKPASERVLPRIALSQLTFTSRFGSWREARLAAGLPGSVGQPGSVTSIRGTADSYTDERLCEVIELAADQTGRGATLTPGQYDAWAREERRRVLAAAADEPVAASTTMSDRFGGWAEALHAAGLLSEREMRRRRHRRAGEYTDEQLIAALVQYILDEGVTPTQVAYGRWRNARLDADRVPVGGLPSRELLVRRLGWPEAVAAAEFDVARRERHREPFDSTSV